MKLNSSQLSNVKEKWKYTNLWNILPIHIVSSIYMVDPIFFPEVGMCEAAQY